MVKTPRTRHAKGGRPLVTIDLEPSEVSPAPEEKAAAPDTTALPEDKATPATPGEPEAATQAREDAEAALAPNENASVHVEAAAPSTEDSPAAGETFPGTASDAVKEPSTETGTSVPPEQEYRPAESMDADPDADLMAAVGREQPKPSYTAPPPAARSDGIGRVAAGVVGGIVALAVAGGLQAAGLLGHPGAGGTAPDQSAEIASLRAEVESLKGAGAEPDTTTRIEELGSGLDTLRSEVTSLRESIPAAGSEGEGMASRLDALESEIKRLAADSGSQPEALSTLGERVASVETEARAAQEASTSAADRLSALEQSVTELSNRVDAQAQQPKIALAIATAALKAAVERGAPFLAELETFAAIHPGTPEIETLRGYAGSGVPTREDLRKEMETAATAMIAASRPTDANAGLVDRLLDSAQSLVTVRPIGQVAGSGVPETIARMEVALNAGELDKALAEYETLPDPVKQAGASFAARLKARADVERMVDEAIANAMRA